MSTCSLGPLALGTHPMTMSSHPAGHLRLRGLRATRALRECSRCRMHRVARPARRARTLPRGRQAVHCANPAHTRLLQEPSGFYQASTGAFNCVNCPWEFLRNLGSLRCNWGVPGRNCWSRYGGLLLYMRAWLLQSNHGFVWLLELRCWILCCFICIVELWPMSGWLLFECRSCNLQ